MTGKEAFEVILEVIKEYSRKKGGGLHDCIRKRTCL